MAVEKNYPFLLKPIGEVVTNEAISEHSLRKHDVRHINEMRIRICNMYLDLEDEDLRKFSLMGEILALPVEQLTQTHLDQKELDFLESLFQSNGFQLGEFSNEPDLITSDGFIREMNQEEAKTAIQRVIEKQGNSFRLKVSFNVEVDVFVDDPKISRQLLEQTADTAEFREFASAKLLELAQNQHADDTGTDTPTPPTHL